MNISILAIGDEILSGKTQDKNINSAANFLMQQGLSLSSSSFCKDNIQTIHANMDFHLKSSDVLIITGGIGPTKDDLTKLAVAQYFDKKIEFNQSAKDITIENYKRFNREISDHHTYFDAPKDFLIFSNPMGLAPGLGFYDDKNKKLVLCAPGVPREFKLMLKDSFFETIKSKFELDEKSYKQVLVRTKGIPEEKIFQEVDKDLWSKLEKFGKVASLPQFYGVDIVVSFNSFDSEFEEIKSKILDIFNNSPIQNQIWQIGSKSPMEFLFSLLSDKNKTISFAESCSGGYCSHLLTDISGSSKVFNGSVVSYSNEVKKSILDVSDENLVKLGAVSEPVAKEMAIGTRKKCESDYSISFTGIAGPTGGSEEKPVGTVCIGIDSDEFSETKTFYLKGDRKTLKKRFVTAGILYLIDKIR